MKFKFYACLLAIVSSFFLSVKSQSITFNYASSGLNTSDCNIFYPAVAVQQHNHTTIAFTPQFTGSQIVLPAFYSTVTNDYLGSGYGITYTFTANHIYSIKASVNFTTNNPSAPQPKFYVGLASTLPSSFTACGATGNNVTNSPFSSIYSVQLTGGAATVQVPNFTGSGQAFLLIGGYPNGVGSQSFSHNIYVNSISIVDVPPITGSDYLCSGTNQTYSINTTYPVAWMVSPSGKINYTTSGANLTASYASAGTVTLTATVTTPNGNIVLTKDVAVGGGTPPLNGTYSTASATKTLQTVNSGIPIGNVYTQYQWSGITNPIAALSPNSPTGTGFSSSGTTYSFNIASGQQIGVDIKGNNVCGVQVTATRVYIQSSGGFKIAASPNPARGNINLRLTNIVSKSANISTGMTKISLYNSRSGALVQQWTFPEVKLTDYNLRLNGVQAGTYDIRVERNRESASTKIIIDQN